MEREKFTTKVVFNEQKFPAKTYVLQSARCNMANNLYSIEGVFYYRGTARDLGLTKSRLQPGTTLPEDMVTLLRNGNFGMPEPEIPISPYFINSSNVVRVGLQLAKRAEDSQELYEVTFSALAAPYFANVNFSFGGIVLSESVVQKKFADSYNGRQSTTLPSGASSSVVVTRQISFDYLTRNKSVELYFASKGLGDADQLLDTFSSRYAPELVTDRQTGRNFYNYVNINGYSMGEDFREGKTKTEFTPLYSLNIEHVCGEVKKANFQAVGEYQRDGV